TTPPNEENYKETKQSPSHLKSQVIVNTDHFKRLHNAGVDMIKTALFEDFEHVVGLKSSLSLIDNYDQIFMQKRKEEYNKQKVEWIKNNARGSAFSFDTSKLYPYSKEVNELKHAIVEFIGYAQISSEHHLDLKLHLLSLNCPRVNNLLKTNQSIPT
ncbi:hypothetical protein AKO1_004692, partial [Acrasis kona]